MDTRTFAHVWDLVLIKLSHCNVYGCRLLLLTLSTLLLHALAADEVSCLLLDASHALLVGITVR
jgi:hypothetical protein